MTDTSRRPEHILVVDDRHTTREIIRDMLECEGFDEVKVASDGMQALRLMSVEDFSLVITDLDMAPMPGSELLQCTRHHPRMKNIPFVLATGSFEDVAIAEAETEGFASVLLKPFNISALAHAVDKGLNTPAPWLG